MQALITLLFLLFITVGLLLFYILFEKRKKEDFEKKLLQAMFHHEKVNLKDELLTHNEQRFYHDLEKKFGNKYRVYPLVALTALFRFTKGESSSVQKHDGLNKFYLDFILCSKDHFKPVCVIELNDRIHTQHSRKLRDSYFSEILNPAEIKYFSYESNYVTYDHYLEEIEKALPA